MEDSQKRLKFYMVDSGVVIWIYFRHLEHAVGEVDLSVLIVAPEMWQNGWRTHRDTNRISLSIWRVKGCSTRRVWWVMPDGRH
jgi:hypothetical protein